MPFRKAAERHVSRRQCIPASGTKYASIRLSDVDTRLCRGAYHHINNVDDINAILKASSRVLAKFVPEYQYINARSQCCY